MQHSLFVLLIALTFATFALATVIPTQGHNHEPYNKNYWPFGNRGKHPQPQQPKQPQQPQKPQQNRVPQPEHRPQHHVTYKRYAAQFPQQPVQPTEKQRPVYGYSLQHNPNFNSHQQQAPHTTPNVNFNQHLKQQNNLKVKKVPTVPK